jgi:hypothetical protein
VRRAPGAGRHHPGHPGPGPPRAPGRAAAGGLDSAQRRPADRLAPLAVSCPAARCYRQSLV